MEEAEKYSRSISPSATYAKITYSIGQSAAKAQQRRKMATSDCIAQVVKIFEQNGYPPLTASALAWVEIYCDHGLDADWIAARLQRLLTLKQFLAAIKALYQHLNDAELKALALEYLNGRDAAEIKKDLNANVTKLPKPGP